MKYLNESYWTSRKEKEDDLEDVRLMLSDLTDDDISVLVNGYDSLGDSSIIEYIIHPKYPERNWPNHSYLKWENIKYKVIQIQESMDSRYEIYAIKMKLRWSFGKRKEGEWMTAKTVEEFDREISLSARTTITPSFSDLIVQMKITGEKEKTLESKKSKRKIGSFAKHCIDLGYTGAKGGRCSGPKNKKRKVFQGYKLPLEFDKDYYYDKQS